MKRCISERTVSGLGLYWQVLESWFHSTSSTGGIFIAAFGMLL